MSDTHDSTILRARRQSRARAVRLCVAAWVMLLATSPAVAVTNVIPVSTTDDEVIADGDCSLREAIIAANTDAAADACPAGSSSATDTIELVAGLVYRLTLPEPGDIADVDPEGGDLNISDGAAALDVFLRSDQTGEVATIEQALAGLRVIRTTGSLRLVDLEIRGGQAVDCGAGVQAVGAVGIDIQHSIFALNTALNGGAVCMLSATGVATISDSLFVDNRAASTSGGAVFNKGNMTITDTAFVRNEAQVGSAVHHQSGAAALQITGSCFSDNRGGDAVSNTDDTNAAATGCWWGASNGPSGQGPGGGDAVGAGVDFGGFLTAVPAVCRPFALERNGAFELFEGDPEQPAAWKLANADLPTEGRHCDVDTGTCFVRLDGDGSLKTVKQVVRVAGSAGDQLTIFAQSRAKDVPVSGGPYRVRLIIVHQDGSRQVKTLPFSPGRTRSRSAARR